MRIYVHLCEYIYIRACEHTYDIYLNQYTCGAGTRFDDAVVQKFRETCGPWDVNFAREIRPKTIRAKFGIDGVKNAVHCTDLPDDGDAEVRYFFDILEPC